MFTKMWYHLCVLYILILSWSCAFSEDCITPLGKSSKCVSINDCPDLLAAFKQKPLPIHVSDFLRRSNCGFQDRVPKVCCGPLTEEKKMSVIPTPVTAPNQNVTSGNHSITENFAEDASPAPLGHCGNHIVDKKFEHRIYGGNDTDIGEFPWMAVLRYKSADGSMKFKCGGALINHRYVLTAAHCLAREHLGGKLTLSTVRLGEHDTSNELEKDCQNGICADMPQEIPVVSTYTHPKYNYGNRLHDIAILKLASRAAYTDYVQPICLARRKRKFIDGEFMYQSGWGRTLTAPSSPVKQKLSLPYFNKEKCVEVYKRKPKTAFLIPSQICAGGVFKKDGCDGDSGGPLMKKTPEGFWEAVGVLSFARGCGLPNYPAIYTSVADYYSWIKSTLYSANQL